MTAIVCFHDDFDHARFLRGEYDAAVMGTRGYGVSADALASRLDDEDSVFGALRDPNLFWDQLHTLTWSQLKRLHLAGGHQLDFWMVEPGEVEGMGVRWRADRVYHVDKRENEVWTLHPETGAALSSHNWEFEEVEG